jgi:hypothetical protein
MFHKQAMIHKYKDGWTYAEEEEYKVHGDNGTWADAVTMPAGKLTRLNARLVVCGNLQNTGFWRESYAAVARSTRLKVLLALVTALDLECDQADVVTAFLNGSLDDDEHILLLVPTSSTIATTLYYPTHTYIAALLHSCSINSVLHLPPPLYVRHLDPSARLPYRQARQGFVWSTSLTATMVLGAFSLPCHNRLLTHRG